MDILISGPQGCGKTTAAEYMVLHLMNKSVGRFVFEDSYEPKRHIDFVYVSVTNLEDKKPREHAKDIYCAIFAGACPVVLFDSETLHSDKMQTKARETMAFVRRLLKKPVYAVYCRQD